MLQHPGALNVLATYLTIPALAFTMLAQPTEVQAQNATPLSPGLYRITAATPTPLPTIPAIIQQLIKENALPAAAIAAAAVGTTTIVTVAANSPNGLLTLVQAFLPFLTVHKRRLPWGRVVDGATNQPIDKAIVTIFDEGGRPRQTSRSKTDGSFGTLLPIGSYQLAVEYPGYQLNKDPHGVILFPTERLYEGQFFEVANEHHLLPLVVALQPIITGWEHETTSSHWWHHVRILQARFSPYFLIGGTILTIILLTTNPSTLAISLSFLYLFLLIFELLINRVVKRMVGSIREAGTEKPIALAIIRLLDAQTKHVVATEVSLPGGHFLLVPEPGRYELHVIHPGHDPYIETRFIVRKWSLGLKPIHIALTRKDANSLTKS